ncbi:MAG TPA: LLM class flavin-dependent oxidoreductase [Acidimicrobiales bacterium]|nr:LLM class flavin-dependent oxidoreductase [Acidimicrobiales bacterium]
MPAPLRFGVFLAPFHPVPHNPTLSLEHDLQAIEALERLGFDEVWVGEHHSGGLEIISSPEVFIAAAAQRTRRIRLGTGVSSLPYHHPFMLTDRMVLLDHLTRGRAMLGCGPGQLVSDAIMMGIDPDEQRRMMGEGLDAIMALLRTREPVSMTTDWFTLRDARLQLANYTHPHMEVAVAGSFSPAGPSHAGRNGVGLISIGATSPQGFALLASHWEVYETEATAHGHAADRSRWRLVAPMLLADTDAEARRAVRYGYPQITGYLAHMLPTPPSAPRESLDEQIDIANQSGAIVIGTADMAIAQIERLLQQSGGFGTVLLNGGYWGDFEATLRSYEIFAERVMPFFNGQAAPPQRSFDYVMGGEHDWRGTTAHAMTRAADDYAAGNPAFAARRDGEQSGQ